MQNVTIHAKAGPMPCEAIVTHLSGSPFFLTFEDDRSPVVIQAHIAGLPFDVEADGALYRWCAIEKIDGPTMHIGFRTKD